MFSGISTSLGRKRHWVPDQADRRQEIDEEEKMVVWQNVEDYTGEVIDWGESHINAAHLETAVLSPPGRVQDHFRPFGGGRLYTPGNCRDAQHFRRYVKIAVILC